MNNITGLNNFYIPNTLDGLNGIDSSISGSSLLLDGSNAMLSNLNVGTHKLINVVEPTVSSDGANKNYVDTAISSAGTSYLKLDGTTSMTGSLNINNNDIINIKMLKSVVGSDLTLQRGLSTVLQLTSSESIFSLPVVISSTLSALVGINLNNSKIINCYSLTGYANNNLIFNYLSGVNVLPKITLTATQTLITDGLKISHNWLDMSGNAIVNIPNGNNPLDGVNLSQMQAADNLRILKGGDTMTGTLNMNNNDITNIKMLKSVVGSDLTLQRGISTVLQLTSSEAIFSLPVVISSTLSALVGINLNNSKIINCYSLTGSVNNNLTFNYLNNLTVLPKITLTLGETLINDLSCTSDLNMNAHIISSVGAIWSNGISPLVLYYV